MRKNKIWILLIVVAAAGAFFFLRKTPEGHGKDEILKTIHPTVGTIQTIISTTGTVLPKNRLEVKPPVAGRIEKVLVQEGNDVKVGDILAWMSSTERAALLDAARGKGEEELKYWQEIYKPIPLLSPIDGQVIVATIQPGQTVTTTDAVTVLSDRLIVRAQVDETDIGKISLAQAAVVSLDAYPNEKIKAKVDHIYFESKTVNNVTIYEVDLLPENIPDFFRSGMNASVDFIQGGRENVLTLPITAVQKEGNDSFVMLKGPEGQKGIRTAVKTGLSDDKNIEILEGISEKDEVIVRSKKYAPPQAGKGGSNPLAPQRRR